MYFELSEEHLAVQKAARDFAVSELLPGVIERDTHQRFPEEQIHKLASLGFLGMMVDTRYHGAGMDTLSYVLALEEIAKVDASTAVILSVNNSLVCWGLEAHGNESQKEKYLKRLAAGEVLGAFCLSEPEAGSDATSLLTSAVDNGDHYLLNGTKNWITNGGHADVFLVMAQSNPDNKHKGINALIIEKSMKGFVVGKKEDKLGIRGSDTHSLMFNDVKVPKENRIGNEGTGFTFAMQVLNGGRIGIAAQALGIATGAYETSLSYAKQRKAFGKTIAEHQAIQFKLADMATHIEAARMMVYKAAWLKDQGQEFSRESAMAKLFASEVAMDVANEAVQIHGGYGYVKEYHVERMMRDAKITQIYEGTSEIQRLVISRALIK